MMNFELSHICKNWNVIKNNLFVNYYDNEFLTEDLFQIEKKNFIIDIGWYEGASLFYIYLIKDFEWDLPLIKISAYSREQCFIALEFCVNYENILS